MDFYLNWDGNGYSTMMRDYTLRDGCGSYIGNTGFFSRDSGTDVSRVPCGLPAPISRQPRPRPVVLHYLQSRYPPSRRGADRRGTAAGLCVDLHDARRSLPVLRR